MARYGIKAITPDGYDMIDGYTISNIVDIVPIKLGAQSVTLPPLAPGQYYEAIGINGVALDSPLNYGAKFDTIKINGNVLTYTGYDTNAESPYIRGLWESFGIVVIGRRS